MTRAQMHPSHHPADPADSHAGHDHAATEAAGGHAGHADHGSHSGHDHRADAPRRTLAVVFALTLIFLVIEAAGGFLTGSLALLADAGHMLSDVAALGLALFASWYASRPATSTRTYGFYRAEILAALVNSLALFVIVGIITWEAIERLRETVEVASGGMLVVAVAGLVVNLFGAWLLYRQGGDNLNVRGALLHVLGDALGSVAAIVAALVMLTTGFYRADAIISLVIGVIIVVSAYRILRQTFDILMEAVPPHLNLQQIRDELNAIPGVQKVHDLHVWTLTTGFISMSGHLVLARDATVAERQRVLLRARERLNEQFAIQHATIQLESPDDPEQPITCSGDPRCL